MEVSLKILNSGLILKTFTHAIVLILVRLLSVDHKQFLNLHDLSCIWRNPVLLHKNNKGIHQSDLYDFKL